MFGLWGARAAGRLAARGVQAAASGASHADHEHPRAPRERTHSTAERAGYVAGYLIGLTALAVAICLFTAMAFVLWRARSG